MIQKRANTVGLFIQKELFQVCKLISKSSKSKIIHITLGSVFCVGKRVYDNPLRKAYRGRQGQKEHLLFSSPFIRGENLGEMQRVLTPTLPLREARQVEIF
jgi:hypothetical protein